jgi:hypothetical protein
MPIHRFGSRYSRWDGTQQIGPLSADDLMRAMSEDLMQDGDVNRAMQRLFRWGFQRPDGEEVPGLQGLMQRLRDRRQEQLERYDLQSMQRHRGSHRADRRSRTPGDREASGRSRSVGSR